MEVTAVPTEVEATEDHLTAATEVRLIEVIEAVTVVALNAEDTAEAAVVAMIVLPMRLDLAMAAQGT